MRICCRMTEYSAKTFESWKSNGTGLDWLRWTVSRAPCRKLSIRSKKQRWEFGGCWDKGKDLFFSEQIFACWRFRLGIKQLGKRYPWGQRQICSSRTRECAAHFGESDSRGQRQMNWSGFVSKHVPLFRQRFSWHWIGGKRRGYSRTEVEKKWWSTIRVLLWTRFSKTLITQWSVRSIPSIEKKKKNNADRNDWDREDRNLDYNHLGEYQESK